VEPDEARREHVERRDRHHDAVALGRSRSAPFTTLEPPQVAGAESASPTETSTRSAPRDEQVQPAARVLFDVDAVGDSGLHARIEPRTGRVMPQRRVDERPRPRSQPTVC
jgi:hypothetical protein